jgi:hypothetical protein
MILGEEPQIMELLIMQFFAFSWYFLSVVNILVNILLSKTPFFHLSERPGQNK